MQKALLGISAVIAQVQYGCAYSPYFSRPDLSPPKLNITIPASSDVGPGYLFVAPYSADLAPAPDGSSRPQQPAAYILTNDGDLVWSSLGYVSGFVGNFHVTSYEGKQVLVANEGTIDLLHAHGFGHVAILNEGYERIKTVTAGNHKVLDLHEFTVVDGKTALVEVYDPVQLDLTPYHGTENQTWIADAVVQELDIETGKVLFEWRSLDHVDPSLSVLNITQNVTLGQGDTSTDSWDYFHINSVDKNTTEGNYLVSGRHVSAIYKLDGKTGDIIWQVGGKNSNFTLDKDAKFGFQHDARFHGRYGDIQYISFFDNSAGSNGHQGAGQDELRNYSTAKLLKLNTADWTATIIKDLPHPDKILAPSQGNTQILPNGNFFVNWGQKGTVTEFRANDSTPIFNAYLDTFTEGAGSQNYRGFRQEWVGRPVETPALIALASKDGTLELYVSWNGDTETKTWKFYVEASGGKQLLGESARSGFETKFTSDKAGNVTSAQFVAEAVDAGGKILTTTSFVRSQPKVAGASSGQQKVLSA